MKYRFYIIICLILTIIGILFYRYIILPHISPVHFENDVNPYVNPNTTRRLLEQGYRFIECNRRIRDRDYVACTWYRTGDHNIVVTLDLYEDPNHNAPVLYYDAGDANTTITILYQCLLNASGGPIQWPPSDPNKRYSKFMNKQLMFYPGTGENSYVIRPSPKDIDRLVLDEWVKTDSLDIWRGQ